MWRFTVTLLIIVITNLYLKHQFGAVLLVFLVFCSSSFLTFAKKNLALHILTVSTTFFKFAIQHFVACRCADGNGTTGKACGISYWCIFISIAQWTVTFTSSETTSKSACHSCTFRNKNAINSSKFCRTENQVPFHRVSLFLFCSVHLFQWFVYFSFFKTERLLYFSVFLAVKSPGKTDQTSEHTLH